MEDTKIIVIIPTLNEINNLPILVNLIFNQDISNLSILIVDDNSPDGTADCASELSKIYDDKIYVLGISYKSGLANAYKEGFNWAISKGYDILIQMDADLSHNPNYIEAMITNLKDYDVVIGSRYIEYGKTSNKWSFFRKSISLLGNFGIRHILAINIRDITSGFKAFNCNAAKSINWDQIHCTGFGFQAEVTFQCYQQEHDILEMPILFEDRLYGKSKMTLTVLAETFLKILAYRFPYIKKINISNP
jgi:dolichol-phosphate mannosyltransferase